MMILTNDFHNTEYRTRKTREELDAIEATAPWNQTDADRAFIRKTWKALCGTEGCTCSQNSFGERRSGVGAWK